MSSRVCSIWALQVARRASAMLSSLRPQEKTLILFVIRDHVGSTPMSNLTATLTQDMEKIWASLSKVGLITVTS